MTCVFTTVLIVVLYIIIRLITIKIETNKDLEKFSNNCINEFLESEKKYQELKEHQSIIKQELEDKLLDLKIKRIVKEELERVEE